MAQLYSYLKDRDCKVEVSDTKCKLVFEMFKEQTKEEQDAGCPVDGFRAKIKIQKIPDSQNLCVDFTRLAGNQWHYLTAFQDIQKSLKDLNDASVAF